MPKKKKTKPECDLSTCNRNILALASRATRALKDAKQYAEAEKLRKEIFQQKSYDDALALILEYVEVI